MLKNRGLAFLAHFFFSSAFLASSLLAQDTLTLVDGEKLLGKFVRSTDSAATFKSDIIGEITVDWSKVATLQTKEAFAVVPKNVKLERKSDLSGIAEGTLDVANQSMSVTPAGGQAKTIPLSDTSRVLQKDAFENAVQHSPSFFADWGGSVTLGASLVQATQQSRAYNGSIDLVRTIPNEDWLRRRNRTIFDFSTAYGTISQPGTATIKTNIIHLNAERDEYLTTSVFAFGQATFDHNYSLGLDLQQTFGGGLGWSVIKRPNNSLDLKGSVTYIRQSFKSGPDQSLIGSTFQEDYERGLRRGIKFSEHLLITPAWNNLDALLATGSAVLTMPVYKRMNFSFGFTDNYLHDPPPTFRKNSFQATMGLTYALR